MITLGPDADSTEHICLLVKTRPKKQTKMSGFLSPEYRKRLSSLFIISYRKRWRSHSRTEIGQHKAVHAIAT